MNRWAYQQKAMMGLGCVSDGGIFRRPTSSTDVSVPDGVVCPKPRRAVPVRPSPVLQINNQQAEACESKAGNELLDMILTKGAYGGEKSNFQMASSPPFFSGSPPTRASNPLIQDVQFGNDKLSPLSAAPEPLPSPSSSARKNGGGGGGCVRVKFGHNHAPVRRVEGFNCRGNCSISAVA